MPCNSCVVREYIYELQLQGNYNQTMHSEVVSHLQRTNHFVRQQDDNIFIKESGVRDFLDFCKDFLELDLVFFRIQDEEWRPITKVTTLLQTEWVDRVIHNEQVICYYQPIVNTEKDIIAYELLARFHAEDGSIIYPNEIFSAAKERGRLYALDRLCRLTAVKYAVQLNKKAFINFIPTSIYSPEFCLKSTVTLANELGLDPYQLVFEVVETEKVEDIEHLKSILTYYKEKGFQYALDDVGEGYSTIEMLLDLKPHIMKLDMKYVQGVTKDHYKQEVAKKFLQKAQSVGSTPLAEGIETQEEFEWFRQIGYELFQGYYFGKPSPEPLAKITV